MHMSSPWLAIRRSAVNEASDLRHLEATGVCSIILYVKIKGLVYFKYFFPSILGNQFLKHQDLHKHTGSQADHGFHFKTCGKKLDSWKLIE